MTKRGVFAVTGMMVVTAAPALAGPTLPADVVRFVARHESCEHWMGEDAYDAARGRQIKAGVAKTCPGIDRTRAALLHRYARNTTVSTELAGRPELDR